MDEQDKAIRLLRAKQKIQHRAKFPREVREKMIREKMDHYKSKVLEAVSEENKENLQTALRKLVEVRAELLTLQIQDSTGKINKMKLNTEMEQYYRDCYTLMYSFEALL